MVLIFFFSLSVHKRAGDNRTVQNAGKERWLRVGGDASHSYIQHKELSAPVYRMCELCSQVSVYYTMLACMKKIWYILKD